VDVVIDVRTGTLTLYVADGQVVTEALLLVPDAKGTVNVALAKVEGSPGAFAGRHEALSAEVAGLRVRVTIDGKACDGDLTPDADRPQTPPTGFRVKVDGGPTFEVTRGPKTGEYGFPAVDETFDGGSYVIEGPTLTADARVYTLVAVEGERGSSTSSRKSIDARRPVHFSIRASRSSSASTSQGRRRVTVRGGLPPPTLPREAVGRLEHVLEPSISSICSPVRCIPGSRRSRGTALSGIDAEAGRASRAPTRAGSRPPRARSRVGVSLGTW
jgi:hypothetical protein